MRTAKQLRLLRDIGSEWVRESIPNGHPAIEARPLADEHEVYCARQLATLCFKELGKIDGHEVNEDNVLIHDKFLPYSTYFGAFQDGEIRATTRLIWSPETTVDDLRLPVDALSSDWQDQLRTEAPGMIGEIGSLSKLRGTSNVATLKVIRELFGYADRHDVRYLVCGLDPHVVEKLYAKIFGGALQPLHDQQINFPGIQGGQMPYIIDLPESFRDHREGSSTRQSLGERAVGMFVRNYFKSHVPSWR